VVAHVLRLRAALLVGAVRGSPGHMARTIAGVLGIAVLVGAACWAILRLRDGEAEVAAAVTVLAGSAVTLGFTLAPLVTGAVDPLDPRRFGVLGIPARPLAATLVLAGVISIPIIAVAAVYICLAILWESHGVPWPLGAVGVLLGILTCILLARVSMALSAMFLRDRR
jgi:ABC-2 type transport system permease protein